ncbi:signal peptidase II [Atopostipes suicloacalis DSM 15692]|uniref:Lipoprotein signal peptidase n=1 Tax=Atopostipes suicloacalis DSM 15692 TaxID=1121025 RepID=A0A1M4Y5T8_9LACT|nr:signal peptidase II [Atopostipes suicloacalis]SHF01164.1 signal peptidase II [Atopostipes suicloacalis DSM 15692]
MFLYLILTIILVTIDQITKYLTVQNLALFEVKEIIPKFLSFTYIQNSGAAWSLLEGKMWFFYIITLIVIAFLLYYLYTEGRKDKILGVILSIILAGTLGNFIDRVLFQYVVDMIKLEFINFPIFNVADMLLTIGVAVLLFYTIYEEKNPRPSEGDMR